MTTSTAPLSVSSEALQHLMEVGYVAAGSGQLKQAASIFAGIQAVRPDSEYPDIGMAVLFLNAGRHEDSIRTLQDALNVHPQSDLLKSFLGLALRRADQTSESDRYLQEVIASGNDKAAVELATSLLNPSDD